MSSVSSQRASAIGTIASHPKNRVRAHLWVSWSSLFFAFLQSVCTFLMAVAGLRLIIGVSSLALSAEVIAVLDRLHAGWLRIPMISFAFIGATLNLIAILQIWRLRARPASQWRQAPLATGKLRMERWQLALSLITFVLIAVEEGLHLRLFHHL
ncbi:MAG: hypothetical protein ABSE46_07280 [Terracidiphilus sp.]|jgi:hypothetical protein